MNCSYVVPTREMVWTFVACLWWSHIGVLVLATTMKNLKTMLSISKDGNHHTLETKLVFVKQRNQLHNIFNRWLQLQRLGVSSVHRQIFLLMHLLGIHLVSSTWRQASLQPMVFPFGSFKEPMSLTVKLVGMKEQDRKGVGSWAPPSSGAGGDAKHQITWDFFHWNEDLERLKAFLRCAYFLHNM